MSLAFSTKTLIKIYLKTCLRNSMRNRRVSWAKACTMLWLPTYNYMKTYRCESMTCLAKICLMQERHSTSWWVIPLLKRGLIICTLSWFRSCCPREIWADTTWWKSRWFSTIFLILFGPLRISFKGCAKTSISPFLMLLKLKRNPWILGNISRYSKGCVWVVPTSSHRNCWTCS